ncbi:hypothetical protein EB235_02920 [Mesorhizobium loti R88b]|uniref:Uncharacterized protein n=1 Tax=Mesorhizobium loti R88b TaxID=935548 RepID=A0A6M7WKW9_RHILI|nr:hypothetical protein EB235_02920 [Mesorhizobium loti R88b]
MVLAPAVALRCADIQVRPACKRRLPALPVLTYEKYAPLVARATPKTTLFGRFAPVFDSGSA